MEYGKINTEMLICDIILGMERPFKISELLKKTDEQGIKNRDFVLDVLNQLCESGVIKYSEIQDDVWAYKKVSVA